MVLLMSKLWPVLTLLIVFLVVEAQVQAQVEDKSPSQNTAPNEEIMRKKSKPTPKPKSSGVDVGLPGYLVNPKKTSRRTKLYANGNVPEKIEDTDPSNDQVNSPLEKNGETFYHKNPCRKYKENKKSMTNYSHKKGCKKAANHLAEWSKANPLPKCPEIEAGRCLQFYAKGGRCYVLANFNGEKSYILINNCLS